MNEILKKLKKNLKMYNNAENELTVQDLHIIKDLAKSIKLLEDLDTKYNSYNSKTTYIEEQPVNLMMWARSLDNQNGSSGAHWTIDETTNVAYSKGIDFDAISKEDWYMALNMAYSDYCVIANKYGVDNIDFYVDLAKQWLWDDDTINGNDKLDKYYKYIVKH